RGGSPPRRARPGLAGGPAPHRRGRDLAARRVRRHRRDAGRPAAAPRGATQPVAPRRRRPRRRRGRAACRRRPVGPAAEAAVTAAPVEVADWTKEAKSFRPTMTAEVGAPPETALAAMAAGLSSQGYRIKDRTDTGFRASHRKLVQGILGLLTASDADII